MKKILSFLSALLPIVGLAQTLVRNPYTTNTPPEALNVSTNIVKASTPVLTVAATNSLHKDLANYRCTGLNDETNINAALIAAGVGGKVQILGGTFWIGASILPTNCSLVGVGYGSLLKMMDGISSALNMVEMRDSNGGEIRGLRINGENGQNETLSGSQKGIVMLRCTNVIVAGNWVEHFGNIDRPSCIGINPSTAFDCIIADNVVTDTVDGINSSTMCRRLVISGNRITSTCRDYGINVIAMFESQIIGNSVANTFGAGINVSSGSSRNSIVGNTVTNSFLGLDGTVGVPAGISVNDGLGLTAAGSNNIIAANIVRSGTTNGIWIQSGLNNTVSGNDVYGGGTVTDIRDTATNTLIAGNMTSASGSSFVLQTGSFTGDGAGLTNIPLATATGTLPTGQPRSNNWIGSFTGDASPLTNGSPAIATNNAAATDGMVLSKTGTKLKWIAGGGGGGNDTLTNAFGVTVSGTDSKLVFFDGGGQEDVFVWSTASRRLFHSGTANTALTVASGGFTLLSSTTREGISVADGGGGVTNVGPLTVEGQITGNGAGLTNLPATALPAIGQGVLALVTTNCTVNVGAVNLTTNVFLLTASTNVYFVQPTSITAGKQFVIHILQDSLGTRTVGFDPAYWKFPSGLLPVLTTNAGARDVLSCVVSAFATNIYVAPATDFR